LLQNLSKIRDSEEVVAIFKIAYSHYKDSDYNFAMEILELLSVSYPDAAATEISFLKQLVQKKKYRQSSNSVSSEIINSYNQTYKKSTNEKS
jgi:hypothetical protein